MKRINLLFVMLFLIFISVEDTMAEDVKAIKTKDNLDVFTLAEVPESNIKVDANREFFIRIKSNITTGYSWELAQEPDKGKIEFIGKIDEDDEEEDDPPGRKLLGAPGFETLKFKALTAGKTVILLKMVRPWEKDVDPIKTHKINVNIK